jgi:hypothetical protein
MKSATGLRVIRCGQVAEEEEEEKEGRGKPDDNFSLFP